MAGNRILLAAELSRGGATTQRLLPLATALAERGHDVALALPPGLPSGRSPGAPSAGPRDDARMAEHEAPAWHAPPPPGFLAVTYADLLQLCGYSAPSALNPLLDAWLALLTQTAPDLLVVDYAPTAMLAARIAGVKIAAIGDGFSLPALARPMPVMRPWADLPPDAAEDGEGRALAVIEACLIGRRSRGLRALRDLFRDVPSFLCTFPELDHYPGRQQADWFGDIFSPTTGPTADWPSGTGERIYIDLDPRHPALDKLAQVLARLGLPTLIQGGSEDDAMPTDRLVSPTVRVTAAPNRHAAIAASDIVIGQSADAAVPALLQGKPVLLLPLFVEQMMTLHRIATQGFGHGIAPESDTAAIDAAIRAIVDDSACRQRALNFARSYHGYQPAIATDAVADALGDLLS